MRSTLAGGLAYSPCTPSGLLWIWAYAYDPRHGYRGRSPADSALDGADQELESMHNRIGDLESQVKSLRTSSSKSKG
jgi:hypothetical protein